MKKRKVIKFVFQGHRQLKPGEYYLFENTITEWFGQIGSAESFDVYHRIETEEEVPRWRAELGGVYYRANVFLQIVSVTENRCILDEVAFDSGNYFQTESQAQKYLDHCKKYFENN